MTKDIKDDCEGRIKVATVSAPDPQAVAASYETYFGYQRILETQITDEEAALWGAQNMAGRPIILMGPESGTEVYIRIVGNEPADYTPLRSYGWNAIEITVKDADALHEQLQDSPFEIIGVPTILEFSDKIYPMQAVGLAQEVFYLNEVRGDLPAYDLPLARSFVDHIFIMILATPDMDNAIKFYTENFGWSQGNAYFTKYSVINDAFGLDEETPHHLSMTCVGRDVNNEVDQYPENTTERLSRPDLLPPGIAMVSYTVQSLDNVKAPFIAPPQSFAHAPYNGRRAAVCIGNAGELIELIELDETK